MHNLKEIRKDFENFNKLLKNRNLDVDNLFKKKKILKKKKKIYLN